jgi:hypothetical protein
MNKKLRAAFAVLAGISTIGFADLAQAQEDGALVGLHTLRREGGKICMSDHFHNGNSSGQPSRKAAEVAAVRDYAGFTGWEYGNHWANFAIAGSKRMNCTKTGNTWGCELEARPCKPGR